VAASRAAAPAPPPPPPPDLEAPSLPAPHQASSLPGVLWEKLLPDALTLHQRLLKWWCLSPGRCTSTLGHAHITSVSCPAPKLWPQVPPAPSVITSSSGPVDSPQETSFRARAHLPYSCSEPRHRHLNSGVLVIPFQICVCKMCKAARRGAESHPGMASSVRH
jgi:hypothetical protein